MKTAVIVGSAGQDGRLLTERLSLAGVSVVGVARPGTLAPTAPGVACRSRELDIVDATRVAALIRELRPAEVYYLAAFHHASEDHRPDALELYARSHQVHVQGLLHFLDALRTTSPRTKLFYAASSHVFGDPVASPQNEATPYQPRCIYGITKTAGIQCCRFYRDTHGVHASAGILYTHESPLRRRSFLAAKVISAAVDIRAGRRLEKLVVGDLSAEIDWGYAPDYVDAMIRILALDAPDDFVIATGRLHSVREFVEIVFQRLGLDWKAHVDEDPSILVGRHPRLVGDSAKLRRATGWAPSTDLAGMIDHLLKGRGAQL